MKEIIAIIGESRANELRREFNELLNSDDFSVSAVDMLFADYGLEPDYIMNFV